MTRFIRAKSLLWLAVLVAVPHPAAADAAAACEAYGRSRAVFVGRARSPILHRLTWNFGIEEARKKVARATAEYEANQGFGSDPRTRSTRELELLIQKIKAEEELDAAQARTPPPQDMMLTPMDVEVAFRGVSSSVVFVSGVVVKGEDGSPKPVEPGRAYIVYGEYLGPPEHLSLEVIRAGPVIDVDSAEEDLNFLYAAGATANAATVYGTLRQENLENNGRPGVPLPGITIRFSWESSHAEVTTNSNGSFRLSGIGPGSVKIEPSLPGHLMIPERDLSLNVTRGGCFPWGLMAVLDGRVRGSVLRETGAPFSGVQVDLVPVDPRRARDVAATSRATTRTNEHGEFEFSGQRPGSYWLGVNLLNSPSTLVPYPPTYFPGTSSRDLAEPVLIGEGTEHDGFNFLVPAPLARRQIEFHVEPADDQYFDTYACLSQPGQGGRVHPKKPGQPLLLDVVEGGIYQVSVHVEAAGGHFHSQPITFTASRAQTSLTLQVTRASAPHDPRSKCYPVP